MEEGDDSLYVRASDASNNQRLIVMGVSNSSGPVTGAALDSYLNQFGITITDITPSGLGEIIDDRVGFPATVLRSFTDFNSFWHDSPNDPYSYTLNFAVPQSSFSFVRDELFGATPSGLIVSPWRARAFDSTGALLDTVSESQLAFFGSTPAVPFTLTGPGITSVIFDRTTPNTIAGLNRVPTDNWQLDVPTDPRREVVVGSDLMFGNTVPGSIHGFKYEDVDGDGVYNAVVDLLLGGIDITLTGTDGQGNVVNTTETTDANGEFWFVGLMPSVDGAGPATGYTVTETVPAGFVATTPTVFNTDLLSRQELVAIAGQAMIPPPTYDEIQKLLASDGAASDLFGHSVAIDGNVAVVGAYGSSQGAAYVYEFLAGSWTEMAKLTASDGAAGDRFGFSISVSGDTVVVGANYDDDHGSDSGSAYVYERPGGGWVTTSSFDAKLTASDGAAFDYFGGSVSVSGDTVVVGNPRDDDQGSDSGSAYVYERPGGGWVTTSSFDAKLTASDGAASDGFGNSLSVSGDTVVVGAAGDDDNGSDSGSAYVYERPGGGWVTTSSFDAKLSASDGAAFDYFGNSVSVSGDTVVFGAAGDDDNGSSSGSAYVYERPGGGWVTTSSFNAKLTASDGAASDNFGQSVSVSGDTVVVGAFLDDDHGGDSGSAYVYERPGAGWVTTSSFNSKLTASDGAAGDYFGNSVSVSGDTVVVGAYRDDDQGGDSGSAYIFSADVDPRLEVVIGSDLMFGNTVPGSIHGFKYEDIDGDGVYNDLVDLPLAGVDFTLTGTDGQGNVVNTTETTDLNGEFWFTGILPSVDGVGPATGYIVSETVPAGFVATTPTSYVTDLLSRQELVALPGQAMLPPPTIVTVDFDALDASSVPGLEVLHGPQVDSYLASFGIFVGEAVRLPGGVPVLTEVGIVDQANEARYIAPSADNWFQIDDLLHRNEPFRYRLDFAEPLDRFTFTRAELSAPPNSASPWTATALDALGATLDTTGEGFIGNSPALVHTLDGPGVASVVFERTIVNTSAGTAYPATDDFVLEVPDPRREVLIGAPLMFGNTVPGSIHGFKYEDVDGDGVYNAAIDLPLAGVDFALSGTDGQGNVVNTTETTDVNGEFWFTGLLPSANGVGPATGYTVTETVPAGFVATTPTSYVTDLLSRQELVAFVDQAMIPPGDPRVEVLVGVPLEFGNTVPGSIHGFKFQDVDADGAYNDAIDVPLIGVDFTLTGTDGQGNVVNTTETTDVNGEFWFTGPAAEREWNRTSDRLHSQRDDTGRLLAYDADFLRYRSVEPPGIGRSARPSHAAGTGIDHDQLR